MILRKLFLLFLGSTYGFLSAAGVFTVLLTVGLVPRFAGRTHTAEHVVLYEKMVIWGTVTGCFISVFEERCRPALYLMRAAPFLKEEIFISGKALMILIGFFGGMFTGCLAMAIAEMLDSFPILTRRLSFHRGISFVVISMALGKLSGSLLYFYSALRRTG